MAKFGDCLLRTRHYSKCFLYVSSETCRTVLWNKYCYFPYFSNDETKTEKAINLPDVTQLISGRAGI